MIDNISDNDDFCRCNALICHAVDSLHFAHTNGWIETLVFRYSAIAVSRLEKVSTASVKVAIKSSNPMSGRLSVGISSSCSRYRLNVDSTRAKSPTSISASISTAGGSRHAEMAERITAVILPAAANKPMTDAVILRGSMVVVMVSNCQDESTIERNGKFETYIPTDTAYQPLTSPSQDRRGRRPVFPKSEWRSHSLPNIEMWLCPPRRSPRHPSIFIITWF